MGALVRFFKEVERERDFQLSVSFDHDTVFTNMPMVKERLETRINLLAKEPEGMPANELVHFYRKLLCEIGAIAALGFESYPEEGAPIIRDKRKGA